MPTFWISKGKVKEGFNMSAKICLSLDNLSPQWFGLFLTHQHLGDPRCQCPQDMDLPCDGFVLLVGDGDFSFSVSLMKKGSLRGAHVTTSSLETLESIQQHKLAAENMKVLTEMGVQVFLETDARELHTHPAIGQVRYQRIIFNFPLADRHNIKLNRALLADFFSSCSQILSDDGQVMVTLCKGQGGTPADQPMRSWHDSWQVHAMATNAGFILSQVLPFEVSVYPLYHSVGFRFQDKSFNTSGALVHVFEKADVVVAADGVSARGVVRCGDDDYTCSSYVANKLSRNVLEEPNHPVSLLRQRLEESLSVQLEAEIVPDRDSWCILPGHKSSISARPADLTGADEGSQHLQDSLQTAKDRKNEANLTILKSTRTSLLAHGVDRDGLGTSAGNNSHLDQNVRQDICKMVPENPESVFILIKKNPSGGTKGSSKENYHHVQLLSAASSDQDDNATEEQCGSSHDPRGDTSSSLDVYDVQIEGCGLHAMEDGEVQWEETSNQLDTSCTDRVYHCRASVLENARDLCQRVSGSDCSHVCLENVSRNSSVRLVSHATEVDHQAGQCPSNIWNYGMSETSSKGRQCFVVSGKSFLPGSIALDTIAVRHEMMIVQKISQGNTSVQPTPHASMASVDINLVAANHITDQQDELQGRADDPAHPDNFISALTRVVSCLAQSCWCSQTAVSVEDVGSVCNVALVGVENVMDMRLIYLGPETNTRQVSEQQLAQHGSSRVLAGVACQVVSGGDQMLVVVLHLDNIVGHICSITDPRVLWSQSKRFTDQFQPASSFPWKFQPFSLYPMRFTHDLSFWQKDSDSEFDVLELYNIVLYTARDLVCSVGLRDVYTDPETGQVSRCYRLQFVSHDQALPYLVSWKLQSLIRMEVAHKLGVTLR